jgi:hypothetical protein
MAITDGPVLECNVQFKRGRQSRKHLVHRADSHPVPPRGRVPRVSRLMALAIKLDGQIRAGEFEDWAEVARLGHLTRARASQIANLTLLAPDIIEAILHLPLIERGRDPITERHIRPIAGAVGWAKQRRMWAQTGSSNQC